MKKKLTIVFCSSPDYSNNARSLYEFICENYKNMFELKWVIQREDDYYVYKEKIDCVLYGSKEFYKLMNEEADVVFTTHAQLTHMKNRKMLYIELWHGVSPKKIGYLIQNLNGNDEQWLETVRNKVDYFIVPSDFWVPIFSSRFNVNANRVLPLGFPVIRDIIHADGKNNLSYLLKTDLNQFKYIIFYMPTYRKNKDHEIETTININNIFNFKCYDESILLNYLQKNKVLLCIKRHPEETLNYYVPNHQNIINISQEMLIGSHLSVNDILNAADLLVTDYSSLGLEFLTLDKPVVYLNYDVVDYKNNRGILFSDFSFWTDGDTANSITSLIKKLDELLIHKINKENINNKKRLLFKEALDDGGCLKICNFLFKDGNINNDVKYYYSSNEKLKKKVEQLKLQHLNDKSMIELRTKEVFEKQNQIDNILNSKSWKIISKVRCLVNKILFWKR